MQNNSKAGKKIPSATCCFFVIIYEMIYAGLFSTNSWVKYLTQPLGSSVFYPALGCI